MNPIETITKAMRGVLNTPQGLFYLWEGFPNFEGTPPTPREKAKFLRMVRKTTDTMQANRPSVRDELEALFAQGSPATPRVYHLVSLLSRVARVCHWAGQEWPEGMEDEERQRTVGEWGTMETYFTGWLNMLNEYFPTLSIPPVVPILETPDFANQVADITQTDEVPDTDTDKVTPRVDRERLAGFFNPKFKEPRPRPGMEPLPPGFDMFYNALVTVACNFTPTDIGRIAYQVHQSKHVLSRFRNMPFARFARLFYDGCGVPAPKDLAPRTYRKQTTATRFECWLE